MDYREAIVEAAVARGFVPGSRSQASCAAVNGSGVSPSMLDRFAAGGSTLREDVVARALDSFDLDPDLIRGYWSCPARREAAHAALARTKFYRRATEDMADLLRRLVDVGYSVGDVTVRSGCYRAPSEASVLIASQADLRIQWLKTAEAMIEERGGDVREWDYSALAHTRLTRYTYYRGLTEEARRLVCAATVAGHRVSEIDSESISGATVVTVAARPRRTPYQPPRDWLEEVRRHAQTPRSVAGVDPKPPKDSSWSSFEDEVYAEIWSTEDGTVASAALRWPDVDIRRVLFNMDIDERYWP